MQKNDRYGRFFGYSGIYFLNILHLKHTNQLQKSE